jgi:hypothetical protein
MTICLAAIAKENNQECIVFGTDHMVTTALGQFEHCSAKYIEINPSTVAMLAGDPLIFEELVHLKNKNASYQEIKNEIFENFKKIRKEKIKNQIFDMFSIDEKFFLGALEKSIPNPFVAKILEEVAKFNLDTTILLVGFEGEEAQITDISEEGIDNFRRMNFHAIGSGNTQAANALLFQKHNKEENLSATIYNVFKAKKNAEVLQGVGKETDLLLLIKGKGCTKITSEDLKVLDDIYNNELKYGRDESLSKLSSKRGSYV